MKKIEYIVLFGVALAACLGIVYGSIYSLRGTPTAPVPVKVVCGIVHITGFVNPVVYYECWTRFSDGTFIHVEGDSQPCKEKTCS